LETAARVFTPVAKPRYFASVSVILLVVSIVAFSDNLFTDIGQPSNRDPKFIVHGLFGLAWYVLLMIQANLVRVRNLKLHKTLGVATFVVAAGVALSTLYVFVVLWNGWANMAPEVRANRLLLPGYVVCLWLAWRWRTQPAWHKRLIFVGTFFMLGPVLARTYDPLIMSWVKPAFPTWYTPRVDELAFLTFMWVAWLGFFASLAAYDWQLQRRVHSVTVAGLVWMAITWTLAWAT
jgi:hypothetical protein